jgi:hypothetical protein
MDNKDMPAIPTGLIHEDVFNSDGEFCGTVEARYVGLTKREHFAGLAMQSVLNNFNPYEQGDFDSSDYRLTVQHAVGLADALLDELDKVK